MQVAFDPALGSLRLDRREALICGLPKPSPISLGHAYLGHDATDVPSSESLGWREFETTKSDLIHSVRSTGITNKKQS